MLTTMEEDVLELCTRTVTSTPRTSPATGLDSTTLSLKASPATLPFQDWPVSFSWGRAQGSVSPSSKVGAEPAVPAGVGSGRARDLAVSWAPAFPRPWSTRPTVSRARGGTWPPVREFGMDLGPKSRSSVSSVHRETAAGTSSGCQRSPVQFCGDRAEGTRALRLVLAGRGPGGRPRCWGVDRKCWEPGTRGPLLSGVTEAAADGRGVDFGI